MATLWLDVPDEQRLTEDKIEALTFWDYRSGEPYPINALVFHGPAMPYWQQRMRDRLKRRRCAYAVKAQYVQPSHYLPCDQPVKTYERSCRRHRGFITVLAGRDFVPEMSKVGV